MAREIFNTHRSEEPHDRLTQLCEKMVAQLEAEPGCEDVRCVIMLTTDDRGGVVSHGYDNGDPTEDLLMHLTAIFKANGKSIVISDIHGDPSQN